MLPMPEHPRPVLPYSDLPLAGAMRDISAEGITITVPRRRSKYFAIACAVVAVVMIPSALILAYLLFVAARVPANVRGFIFYRAIAPAFCLFISAIWARRLFAKGRREGTVRITPSELHVTEYSGADRRDFAWNRDEIASIACGRSPGQWSSSLQVCSRDGRLVSLLDGHDEAYLNWLVAAIKHALVVLPSGSTPAPVGVIPLVPETPSFELPSPDVGRGRGGLAALGLLCGAYAVWLVAFGWTWSMQFQQAVLIQTIEVTFLGALLWAFLGDLVAHHRRHSVIVVQGVLTYTVSGVLGSRQLKWPAQTLADVCAIARPRPQDGVAYWNLEIHPLGAAPIDIPTRYSEEELQEIVRKLREALGLPTPAA